MSLIHHWASAVERQKWQWHSVSECKYIHHFKQQLLVIADIVCGTSNALRFGQLRRGLSTLAFPDSNPPDAVLVSRNSIPAGMYNYLACHTFQLLRSALKAPHLHYFAQR